MKKPLKKVKRVVGDVVRIRLPDGKFAFGRVLDEPLFAFYDLYGPAEGDAIQVVSKPVLFKIWVMNHAVASGRWKIIGNLPLEGHLREPVRFFKQDALNPREISIHCDGKDSPATTDECRGLERAAVWEPEHVEERLQDHLSGKSNIWVESLRLKA